LEEHKHYRALGLPFGADLKQIKSAYRSLAKKYHPDLTKDPSSGAQFNRVMVAYKTLVAREEKKNYLGSRPHREYRHRPFKEESLADLGKVLWQGKTPEMRAFAARRIGLTGKKGGYLYLRRALTDSSETVVKTVLEAIVRLKVISALEDLRKIFPSTSLDIQLQILQASKSLDFPRGSLALLTDAMQSKKREVRMKAFSLFAQVSKEKVV